MQHHNSEQGMISCHCGRMFTPHPSFKMFIICCPQGGRLWARGQPGSCYTSFSPPLTTGGAEEPLSNLGNSLTSLAAWSSIDFLFPWLCLPTSLHVPLPNRSLGSWLHTHAHLHTEQYHFPDSVPCLPQTSGLMQWKWWTGLNMSVQWPPWPKEAMGQTRP